MRGLMTWLVWLAGYCGLQTLANGIAVELQDVLLLALPFVAAGASAAGLRAAPQTSILFRILIGGIAAFIFGEIYGEYFVRVIVMTLHAWQRDEGLLEYLGPYIGLLVWFGAPPMGMIAGAWLGRRKSRRSGDPGAERVS